MEDLAPENNSFKFLMNIAKSFTDEQSQRMVIRGVASGVLRDRQNEQMSIDGLMSIKKGIENGIVDEDGNWHRVPLRSGHREEWDDILGEVTKAEIDDDNNLWIEAELDEDNSRARDLYRKLEKKAVQLGLSVRGGVTKYKMVFDHEVQKSVMRFDGIKIREVSVTQKPVYPTPYPLAIAKSLLSDPTYQVGLEESMKDVVKSDETRPHGDANPVNSERINLEGAVAQTEEPGNGAEQETQEVPQETAEEVVEEKNPDVLEEPATEEEVTPEVTTETPAEEASTEEQAEPAKKKATSDYAPLPSANTTQEVTTTQEDTSAPAETDPVAQLQESFNALQKQFNDYVASQKDNSGEVQKSQPDSNEDLATVVARAVTASLNELGITKISEEFETVKSEIIKLSAEPNDQSLAVLKAKTEDEDDESDPFVRYEKFKETETSPIRAALLARGQ